MFYVVTHQVISKLLSHSTDSDFNVCDGFYGWHISISVIRNVLWALFLIWVFYILLFSYFIN